MINTSLLWPWEKGQGALEITGMSGTVRRGKFDSLFWSALSKEWIEEGRKASLAGFNSAERAGSCAKLAVTEARNEGKLDHLKEEGS